MKSSFIILIFGLPGSGKTTLSRGLSQEIKVPLLTTEYIRSRLFNEICVKGDKDFSKKELDITYNTILVCAEYLVASGSAVIVDGVYRFQSQREQIKNLANKVGIKFFPIFLHCLDEVIIDRLIAKKKIDSIAPAGVETFKRIKRQYEYPSDKHIPIDTSNITAKELTTMVLDLLFSKKNDKIRRTL